MCLSSSKGVSPSLDTASEERETLRSLNSWRWWNVRIAASLASTRRSATRDCSSVGATGSSAVGSMGSLAVPFRGKSFVWFSTNSRLARSTMSCDLNTNPTSFPAPETTGKPLCFVCSKTSVTSLTVVFSPKQTGCAAISDETVVCTQKSSLDDTRAPSPVSNRRDPFFGACACLGRRKGTPLVRSWDS